MPLNDSNYDKIKLLYEFCKISHFIKKHAQDDAKKNNDHDLLTLLNKIDNALEQYTQELNKQICK